MHWKIYGLKIRKIDGELRLRLDKSNREHYSSLFNMFHTWQQQSAKLDCGQISKEEYDEWRYKYPELDNSQYQAKVPSKAVSDMLIAGLKEMEEEKKEATQKNLTDIPFTIPKISKVFL